MTEFEIAQLEAWRVLSTQVQEVARSLLLIAEEQESTRHLLREQLENVAKAACRIRD